MSLSLYSIKAVILMDNDGNRIIAKYYDDTFPTAKEQLVFEKSLFNKTCRQHSEIVMFDGLTTVYRSNVDLFFYIVGSSDENELMLMSVLSTFYDAVAILLRNQVEKRLVFDNLDAIFLVVDEMVDNGIVFEADGSIIASRAIVRGGEDISLAEQSISQAFQSARDQLVTTLLK
ncbi:coatomer subunit zeta-1 [Sphaeroforma arctica JP610]|uniref:Coatomer subunit zeta n=1 Tax=Sphaeroforma arctica JP610 TaxID=667725 RepID=A0A0L0FYQ1_9EUKA|nr:coatomer subunit zeta-1 [Sphaeroforma arctica JP610]KNC81068.1 coatomer subunit zeta-1 [Sphaeroforma arctica JP610]|eukprot:XP_014154970.1 coatomer subunit zeta-1 [Sphaeroforma arctica JP610]